MSPEGILTIMAPKVMLEGILKLILAFRLLPYFHIIDSVIGSKERVIPITMAATAGSINAPMTPSQTTARS